MSTLIYIPSPEVGILKIMLGAAIEPRFDVLDSNKPVRIFSQTFTAEKGLQLSAQISPSIPDHLDFCAMLKVKPTPYCLEEEIEILVWEMDRKDSVITLTIPPTEYVSLPAFSQLSLDCIGIYVQSHLFAPIGVHYHKEIRFH